MAWGNVYDQDEFEDLVIEDGTYLRILDNDQSSSFVTGTPDYINVAATISKVRTAVLYEPNTENALCQFLCLCTNNI